MFFRCVSFFGLGIYVGQEYINLPKIKTVSEKMLKDMNQYLQKYSKEDK